MHLNAAHNLYNLRRGIYKKHQNAVGKKTTVHKKLAIPSWEEYGLYTARQSIIETIIQQVQVGYRIVSVLLTSRVSDI